MIIPERHRILIVPDFCKGADDCGLIVLKEAIETKSGAKVIVADLKKIVYDEHPGEEMKDADVIELAARKLESLANECNLSRREGVEENHEATRRTVRHDLGNGRTFTIHVSSSNREEIGPAHTIVVFGKSAMFADSVGKTDVLFINPEYDSAWPWKKQYYSGRKAAENYYYDNLLPRERIETAYSFGTVGYGRFPQPSRYAIFTTNEAYSDDWDFKERYPRLSMVNPAIHDNAEAIATQICSFDAREMDIPLLDIDRQTVNLPRQQLHQQPELFRFEQPVHVGGITAIAFGFEFRVPMGNGVSGLRVLTEGNESTVPIERFRLYSDLAALRDAMTRVSETAKILEKTTKRIMIVPDYFTPHDNPAVLELRKRLEDRGYRVTVFCAGDTLEKSRQGLERVCKRRRYDLILTIEAGCLLAARILASHRIYVNPDWTAWEWMKLRLGEESELFEHRGDHEGSMFSYRIDRDEIDMARDMAQRYNIRKGDKLSLGWFSEDIVETGEESRLSQEHMKRFNSCFYIPHLRLDTEEGIRILANETDKILKTHED